MKSIYPVTLLLVSLSACSSMRDMQSSGGSGGMASDLDTNFNSTTYPVTDPRTGQLNYYHGG